MKVSVDIPYPLLKEALEEIENKKGICKILPSARFHILGNEIDTSGQWRFSDLVCDQMGLKSTGTGARYCKNCLHDSEGTS